MSTVCITIMLQANLFDTATELDYYAIFPPGRSLAISRDWTMPHL